MLSPRVTGFFGKIPARGDFVSAGLPSAVIATWDPVVSAGVAAAKASLAERWSDIWLAGPVWRFVLPAGMCGPAPLLGLWMPSTDKVGRQFPLMIAASCPHADPEQMVRHGTAWLDAAEDAGRAAIADDLTPGQLAALIPSAPDLNTTPDTALPHDLSPRAGAGSWWTNGTALGPARGLVLDRMPDVVTFSAMLHAGGVSEPYGATP